MKRCPNCRAQYRGKESCHRCGMELQVLRRIEYQARQQIILAVTALQQKRLDKALSALKKAKGMKEDPLGSSLIQFIEESTASSSEGMN